MAINKVAVIGAGPAGAAAAYYLHKKGFNIEVFEKQSFTGGRTCSFDNGEVRFDTGASFFTNFYPLLRELLKELRLEDEVLVLERKVGLKYKNTTEELAFGGPSTFLKLPFLTFRDKAILFRQTLGLLLQRPRLDLVDPGKLAVDDDASVADWASNSMTKNIYEYCIKPGIEPFWYFSCEEVSRALATVLQARAVDASFYTFKNGMSRITEKLLDGITVFTSCPVDRVSLRDGQYLVEHNYEGQSRQKMFEALVVACPAAVTHKMLEPELGSPGMRTFIATQQYVSNLHAVYLVDEKSVAGMYAYYYPCGDWKTPVATVVLHKGKCPASVKVPKGKELISVYLLNEPSQRLIKEPDQKAFPQVWKLARDFEPSLPQEAEPVALFKRSAAIPVHEVGRYRQAAALQREQSGNLVFAGDYLSTATVEGALRSGRWAARVITGETKRGF